MPRFGAPTDLARDAPFPLQCPRIFDKERSMSQVLFLCTGNYYRSRYAEILFNFHATALGVPKRADSRAIAFVKPITPALDAE